MAQAATRAVASYGDGVAQSLLPRAVAVMFLGDLRSDHPGPQVGLNQLARAFSRVTPAAAGGGDQADHIALLKWVARTLAEPGRDLTIGADHLDQVAGAR